MPKIQHKTSCNTQTKTQINTDQTNLDIAVQSANKIVFEPTPITPTIYVETIYIEKIDSNFSVIYVQENDQKEPKAIRYNNLEQHIDFYFAFSEPLEIINTLHNNQMPASALLPHSSLRNKIQQLNNRICLTQTPICAYYARLAKVQIQKEEKKFAQQQFIANELIGLVIKNAISHADKDQTKKLKEKQKRINKKRNAKEKLEQQQNILNNFVYHYFSSTQKYNICAAITILITASLYNAAAAISLQTNTLIPNIFQYQERARSWNRAIQSVKQSKAIFIDQALHPIYILIGHAWVDGHYHTFNTICDIMTDMIPPSCSKHEIQYSGQVLKQNSILHHDLININHIIYTIFQTATLIFGSASDIYKFLSDLNTPQTASHMYNLIIEALSLMMIHTSNINSRARPFEIRKAIGETLTNLHQFTTTALLQGNTSIKVYLCDPRQLASEERLSITKNIDSFMVQELNEMKDKINNYDKLIQHNIISSQSGKTILLFIYSCNVNPRRVNIYHVNIPTDQYIQLCFHTICTLNIMYNMFPAQLNNQQSVNEVFKYGFHNITQAKLLDLLVKIDLVFN